LNDPAHPQAAAPEKPKRKRLWRRLPWLSTPLGVVLEAALVLLLTAGVLLLVVRMAPLTHEMRLLIQSRVEGLPVGPYGKLHVEGLEGDVWRDFSVRRLTIADDKGVWLQADRLRVRWRYAELLSRRLHVRRLTADRVLVLRQPVAKPQKAAPAPVFSYTVDAIRARIETAPAVTLRRGVYDVTAGFDMRYGGATTVKVVAESVLHPGDHLHLDLNLGRGKALKLDADALEVSGGAIAGGLGLPADLPFSLAAHLSGTLDAGKLTLTTRSGALTPVQASGAWTPGGGAVDAKVVLGASRWTAPLVGRFGAQAEVTVTGKQHQGSIYDLDARFVAPNVVVMGRGPFDMARRSSPGMGLSVVVQDLKKLTPAPQMAGGRATGVISGDLGDLSFSGNAEAQVVELWGYRLAKASGPVKVSWKKGELDVQGVVAGSGGGGSGIIAELAGPSPKATVDVARLKDGRVLIRSLDATGKGVKVQGAGGQNLLFQGLSFKGQLQAADVGQMLGAGASGALEASWSASQDAGPNKPWVFTAEGRGTRLTTGTGEIDRLMGPDPRLSLAAAFQDNVFTVSRAALEGAKERADARGRWALAGDLDFALDWQADGPFGFGPLEIDGKAKGTGRLSGTLGAPRAELSASFDSIAFPQMSLKAARLDLTFAQGQDGSDGTIGLAGQSDYGPARAHSAFRFLPGGMDLTAIDADAGGVKAKGALSLRDGAPSSADLTVAIGPGALLSLGQAQGVVRVGQIGAGGEARADVDVSAKGAVLRGQALALASAHIKAQGPLSRLPYQITADGAWLHTPVKVDGSGVVTKDPHGYSAQFTGSGMLRRAAFKTLEPVQVRLDDNDRFARLRLSLGGGQASVDASQTAGSVELDAALSGVDLSFLSEDFTGRFDADVKLQGQGANLHGAIDANLKDAHSRDASKGLSINGAIKGVLAQGAVTVDAQLDSPQGLTSSAKLVLPAVASAAPFRLELDRGRPMQGTFQADGEIQPLWDLFMGGERTLGGRLVAKVELGGALADPKITGRADLMNGRFDDYPTGLKLRDLNLGAALNTDAIGIDHFQATDGQKGQVSGQGQVSLARGGGGNLTLNLNGFRLIDNDTAQADASGMVSINRGADGKAKISGTLDIVKADVNAAARTGPAIVTMDVVEKNRPFSIDEQVAPPPTSASSGAVAMDVALHAKRGVLIKGRGLNVDMSLDARITGTTLKPVLDGEARVVRGDYDFAGKRFEFDNRGVVHLSTNASLVRLDLTATREDPSLTAVIRIQGTAVKPQITLTSTPVLPNDEVLSQVLFGSSAAQLSPLEAAQVASALTALASGGGFDVVGGLRSFARLDRLAVVNSGTTGVGVAGGKYLSDNVYLELGGGRAGPTAQLEYRVTHNLSLVSKLNNQIVTQTGGVVQGGTELSVRWRHDFKGKTQPAAAKPSTPPPLTAGP
jgi:translocation and assembly module TamB